MTYISVEANDKTEHILEEEPLNLILEQCRMYVIMG